MRRPDRELEDGQYWIYQGNLPFLQKHMDKLSKRGRKLGTGDVTYKVVDKEIFQKTELNAAGKPVPTGEVDVWLAVEVLGQTPKIDGWAFCATIDHMHSEPVLRLVPGHDVPELFHSAPSSNCDHCNTIRRRKETFVLHNEETGEWKQVGRACLKDFFGHNPQGVVRFLSMLGDLDGFFNSLNESGNEINYDAGDLAGYLKYVAACVDELGWVSKAKAQELSEQAEDLWDQGKEVNFRVRSSTSSEAWTQIFMRIRPQAYKNHKRIEVLDKHVETAQKAIEFAKNLVDDGNEYLRTLRVIATDGYFGKRRESGYAASIIAAYLRETEWKTKAKEAKKNPSEYLGTVGGKIEATVTVKWVKSFDNDWGTVNLHTMEDDNGNTIVWFASGSAQPYDKGEELKIRAKVKTHKEYNGTKQTVVTYLKDITP